MNPTDNNPQTGSQNLEKLEGDLQKLTTEVASTAKPTVEVNVEPVQNQTVPPPPPEVPIQPIETPMAPPDIPVDSGKKGFSVMTVAMILLVVALLVAVGYVVYAKFIAPPPVVQTTVPTYLPTDTPLPLVTPEATSLVVPTQTPVSSPSASPTASASAMPSATP